MAVNEYARLEEMVRQKIAENKKDVGGYVVCLVLMVASAAFGGGLTAESAALAVVNAVIPTLAAMGAYEITFGRKDK